MIKMWGVSHAHPLVDCGQATLDQHRHTHMYLSALTLRGVGARTCLVAATARCFSGSAESMKNCMIQSHTVGGHRRQRRI